MKQSLLCALAMMAVLGMGSRAYGASDIVVYAATGTPHGNWSAASNGSAAGGAAMSSPDYGSSQPDAPLAAPGDYFEVSVDAPAGTPYRVWLRLQASGNSKWNDSVWVQFSDAVASNGAALDRIGSASGLLVNLAAESTGTGLSGWGWQNGAYWLSQQTVVQFAGSGTHTIRVQTREDGVQVDQIVLSPATYMNAAPGGLAHDGTILPATGTTALSTMAASSTIASVSSTSAVSIPGTIEAENFDGGGPGVSYFDTTSGNSGGAYRSTDVDIEACRDGGYDVGWIAAGEWLNYSVNATSTGSYTVGLRVASPNGSTLHLGFGGSGSNVWMSVTIPATGGWQNWTTVNVPVSLSAGPQLMTLLFDTGGLNVNSAVVSGGSTSSGGGAGTSSNGAYGGTPRAIPGVVEAEDFDTGGAGVSFGDSTRGNSGGQYRQTDVDIESASGGGYDVGWIAGGEFLNYTVNVTASGAYTLRVRVASPYGGSLHFGLGAPSDVWTGVSVPPTGGWQNWTVVSLPVTLAAGTQLMTLKFDTGGMNLDRVALDAGSTTTTSGGGSSSGGSPADLTVVAWNLHVDSTSAHARAVMDQVAAMSPQPQIVIVEEAWRGVYSDYINELQARTGKTWYGAFGTHCPLGAWNGSSCTSSENEGVGVFSTYPIRSSETKLLPYADAWHSARAAVRAAVDVNGVIVQVFAVHLQPDNVTARANSMSLLKSWSGGFSKPQVMGGDFNATPDEVNTSSNMGTGFIDSWSQVGGWSGNTAFTPSPWMKIDFVLEDWSGKAQPTWSNVLSSTGTISDHSPVITTYTVKP